MAMSVLKQSLLATAVASGVLSLGTNPLLAACTSQTATAAGAAAPIAVAIATGEGTSTGVSAVSSLPSGATTSVGSFADGEGAQTISSGTSAGVADVDANSAAGLGTFTVPGSAASVATANAIAIGVTGQDGLALSAGGGTGATIVSTVSPTGAPPSSTVAGSGGGSAAAVPGQADGSGSGASALSTTAGTNGAAVTADGCAEVAAQATTVVPGGTGAAAFTVDAANPYAVTATLDAGTVLTAGADAIGAMFSRNSIGAITIDARLSAADSQIATAGDGAHALAILSNSGGPSDVDVTLSGDRSRLQTGGSDAIGALIAAGGTDSGSIDLTLSGTDAAIATGGANAHGAVLVGTQSGDNTLTTTLSGERAGITTAGGDASGISMIGSGAGAARNTLVLSGANSAISTAGAEAPAAYLHARAGTRAVNTILLSGGRSRLSTTGGSAPALAATAVGGTAAGIDIGLTGRSSLISTTGADSFGIQAFATAPGRADVSVRLEGQDSAVTTAGEDAHGALLTAFGADDGTVALTLSGQGSRIATSGDDAAAAFLASGGGRRAVNAITLSGDGALLSTTGANAFGAIMVATGSETASNRLELSGTGSRVATTGNGAVGAFLTSSGPLGASSELVLSGSGARVDTTGDDAFGAYLAGNGADNRLAVLLTGENATIRTTGARAAGVVIGGTGGRVLLAGPGATIETTGADAAGVVLDGNSAVVMVERGAAIQAFGAGAPAIYMRQASSGHTVENAGTLYAALAPAVVGGTSAERLVNSGSIASGDRSAATVAFDLGAGDDVVRLEAGSRVRGQMLLGTGANRVELAPGGDASWLQTFTGDLADADISVQAGVPFAIRRPAAGITEIATLDTTGFVRLQDYHMDLARLAGPDGARIRLENAPDIDPGAVLWMKAFGSAESYSGDGILAGGSQALGGVTVGFDGALGDGLRLGVFAGGSGGGIRVDHSSWSIDNVSAHIGVYGEQRFGAAYVRGSLSAGRTWADFQRTTYGNLIPGGQVTTSGSASVDWISPEITIGHVTPLSAGTDLDLRASLRYLGARTSNFDETGWVDAARFQDVYVQSLEGRAEAHFLREMVLDGGWRLATDAYVGASVRTGLGDGREAVLLGQTVAFDATADASFGIHGGLDLELKASEALRLTAGIEVGVATDQGISAAGRVGLSLAF